MAGRHLRSRFGGFIFIFFFLFHKEKYKMSSADSGQASEPWLMSSKTEYRCVAGGEAACVSKKKISLMQ